MAPNYDQVMHAVGYPDPEKIQEVVSKLAHEYKLKPNETNIVDFGCGTGLVGECLHNKGFTKVTGLDISEGMLHIADEKNCHQILDKITLGGEDFLEKFPNFYR